MIRVLITVFCLTGTLFAAAQQTNSKDSTASKKEVVTPIDYHQPDAPMPRLKLVTLDTLSKEFSGKALRKLNKKSSKAMGYASVTRIITNKDIDSRGNIFTMMFNPTCGHCEDQTEIMKKNIDLFQHSRLYLVANANMKTYLPDFIKNHKTHDFYPIMTVGMDSADFIKETFLYGALPQINIYSKDHKLIKSYNGEVSIDSLKQYID